MRTLAPLLAVLLGALTLLGPCERASAQVSPVVGPAPREELEAEDPPRPEPPTPERGAERSSASSASTAPASTAPASTAPASADPVPAAIPEAPAATAPMPATPAAAPSAPAFSTVVAGVPIRLTGILHARVELAQGVQSFDNATAVAPTSAVNPRVLPAPEAPELSFQVQQTRLGMILGEGTDFRGIVEIDFTHFDQSSPTVQAFPRIRIGLLEWHFAEGQRLFLGQTWDLFGNAIGPQLLSHSFNLVGTLFRAGNAGFMRQQLGWSGRFGVLEVALAAGLQGANTGPSFTNIESSLIPTGAARVMFHLAERSVIGVSGIATGIRYTQTGMPAEHRPAFGGMAFADVQLDSLSLHAEFYAAQNLAGTGALTLGAGRFGHDVAELGGYASGRLQLGEHAITAGAGFAGVLNEREVLPGYAPANPMGTPPTTLGTLTPAAGPGIAWNTSAFVGYWLSPLPGLSIVVEPYVFVTRFVLDPADAAIAPVRTSFGGRAGAMFQF